MRIIHKGHGEYWLGDHLVVQAHENFFCVQLRFWGKWRVIVSRLLTPPTYYWKGQSKTAEEMKRI